MGSMPPHVRLHEAWVTKHGERQLSPTRLPPSPPLTTRGDQLHPSTHRRSVTLELPDSKSLAMIAPAHSGKKSKPACYAHARGHSEIPEPSLPREAAPRHKDATRKELLSYSQQREMVASSLQNEAPSQQKEASLSSQHKETPADSLQKLLQLPPRTKRVGGGYRNVPYSMDELLRAAMAALLSSQPDLNAEREGKLQAESAAAEERERREAAMREKERLEMDAEATMGELLRLREVVKRREGESKLAEELAAERQARLHAEAELDAERAQTEKALRQRDKCASEAKATGAELSELMRLRVQVESETLAQSRRRAEDAEGALEAELQQRSMLEERLHSYHAALVTIVKAIPKVSVCSALDHPAPPTGRAGGGEGGGASEAGGETWLERALERMQACAAHIERDDETISSLRRQLSLGEARLASDIEGQIHILHVSSVKPSQRMPGSELPEFEESSF